MRKVFVVSVSVLFLASTAWAGFSVTNAGPFDSNGPQYDPANGVFTHNYTGVDFDFGDIIFSGIATSGGIGSYLSELRVEITDPLGGSAFFAPASGTSWTGAMPIGPLTITGGGSFLTGTAGSWEFRFWEDYDDGGTAAVDAVWTDLSFDFLDAPPPPQYVWVEDFNAGIPAEWTITDNIAGGGPFVWTTNDVAGRDNLTGGDGLCADADADAFGASSTPYDTSLITPSFTVPADATLEFDAAYNDLGNTDKAEVYIHTAGDADVLLLEWDEDHMGVHESIDLSAYAGQDATIEFRYSGPGWDWYFEVDNVGVTPEPASLLLLAVAGLMLRRR